MIDSFSDFVAAVPEYLTPEERANAVAYAAETAAGHAP